MTHYISVHDNEGNHETAKQDGDEHGMTRRPLAMSNNTISIAFHQPFCGVSLGSHQLFISYPNATHRYSSSGTHKPNLFIGYSSNM